MHVPSIDNPPPPPPQPPGGRGPGGSKKKLNSERFRPTLLTII